MLVDGTAGNACEPIAADTAQGGAFRFFATGCRDWLCAVPAALAAPTVVVNSDGSIAVSWRAPDPLPGIITEYQVVVGYSAASSGTVVYSGHATHAVVHAAVGSAFRVRAWTAAGAGPYSAPAVATLPPSSSSAVSVASQPYFYVPFIAGCLLLLLLLLLFVRKYRRQKRLNAMQGTFEKPAADEWEYDPAGLTIGARLGSGNFGIVMAAQARSVQPDLPGVTNVAVKMLADKATPSEKREFVAEAELMKKFSKPWHVNVCGACGGMESLLTAVLCR